MTQFVRFTVDDAARFAALQAVFDEIKSVKNRDFPDESRGSDEQNDDVDYDVDRIRALIPIDVQSNFVWPSNDDIENHRIPSDKPIAISPPGTFRGETWSLVRILDLIDVSEYTLDDCRIAGEMFGELHVMTWSYPYGGLNALIALIEGFGFHVLGVNECGEYEPLE